MKLVTDSEWEAYRAHLLGTDYAFSTVEKAARYLRFLERQHDLDLSALTREQVVALLARQRQAGRKLTTLNSWVRELNLWSKYRGFGWRVSFFRVHHRPMIQVPTEKDVGRLLALRWPDPATDSRNRAILQLLADQGPRRAEVVKLELQDLALTEGGPIISIRGGKGGKDRVLWISRPTYDMITRYVEVYRSASHPKALFTTQKGRLTYAYLGKVVREAGAAVGLPYLSSHKLRHYCVDSHIDHGVSVASVAEVMGHADWETVRIYRSRRLTAQTAEREVREAASKRFS